ncbi:hypothetical protein Agub_g2014, partial [Astrephomene gubernaculifera]
MVVRATADIQPGQELLLSYGERSNDDFYLHYGFVPRANPHDEAVLWPDLEAALDWHYMHFGAQQLSPDQAEPLYRAALAAGQAEQQAEAQQRTAAAAQGQQQPPPQGQQEAEQQGQESRGLEMPPELARQLNQIKAVAGGQVSAAVIRAFAALQGGDSAAAEHAVACRCAQLLCHMAAPVPGAAVAAGAMQE